MEAPKRFIIKRSVRTYATVLATQVEEILREWHAEHGTTMPAEEYAACREIDAVEAAEALSIERAAAAAAAAAAKPVYGTAEFWKAYWAKKKAGGSGPTTGVVKKQTPVTPKCATQTSQAGRK
jgi:hypothetical protein